MPRDFYYCLKLNLTGCVVETWLCPPKKRLPSKTGVLKNTNATSKNKMPINNFLITRPFLPKETNLRGKSYAAVAKFLF